MIKIKRKNETLHAIFEGTTKLHTTYQTRTYINNTLNHRMYQKLPDGQNKKIADCCIMSMQLRFNEDETRVVGVKYIIFKTEEQETIKVHIRDIYKTDLEGYLYHDINNYHETYDGKIVLNKYFNEFINQLIIKVKDMANMQIQKERHHIINPLRPPKKNNYTLKKTEDKTIITLHELSIYHNKYTRQTFYNNKKRYKLYLDKKDERYTLAHMALNKIIFNKPYEELKTLQLSDILFQFKAGNGKLLTITLPENITDFYKEIHQQISPLYFYYNHITDKYSKTVEYLADFINIVLIELFSEDVLEFDTNELTVEVEMNPSNPNIGDTVELEARVIDPHGDFHDGEITFYLE